MARIPTVEHSHIEPRKVRAFAGFNAADYRDLVDIGIDIPERAVMDMADIAGMDALTPSVTTGSIATPIQFLQNWLPGFVNIVTAPRKIDELVGITTSGNWDDEEVVQGYIEQLGFSVPYSDYGNVPLSSWNDQFLTRTVVRFESGMRVGKLEEARSARVKINSSEQKRESATLQLEIQRNAVGFYGYNAGDNLTYGFLSDPNLPNYTIFPNGASGGSPLWSTKTFLEIVKDIRTMVQGLRTQAVDLIDPETTNLTLGLATAIVDYLSVVSDFGISVRDWMTKAYPKIRVVSAPELNGAHSSQNAAYLYAETVKDMSTDDNRVFLQVVPTKFRVTGVQTLAKGYEEDYTNATAGTFVKRTWAVIRYYGN